METAQAMSEPLFQNLEDAVVVAETALLDTQVAVESLRAELDQFTRLHQIQLGPLYGRLDELDALTAETEAAMTGDPEAIRRAVEARARVDGEDPMLFAAANAGLLEDDGEGGSEHEQKPPRPRQNAAPTPDPDVPVRPSKTAQRLYRELARRSTRTSSRTRPRSPAARRSSPASTPPMRRTTCRRSRSSAKNGR